VILERWLGEPKTVEQRGFADAAFFGLFDGARSTAGVVVSEEGSLRNTAVLACVRILSNSTAMLPLPVYKRLSVGKERATDHPLYSVLQEQANPEMTAFELRRWLMQWALLYGNGYAEIEWTQSGQVAALWPLTSAQMTVERRGGAVIYKYTLPSGQTVDLPSWKVLHLRGMSGDGLVGYSVIRTMMMEAIGLGLATQEFGARFFGNGARPGIILEHPGTLSDKAYGHLKASWTSEHEGLSNAHRLRILEEGMKASTVAVPPNEAQFLETRKFQVTEIARAFGVPPHLIGDMEKATFSNIEHQYMEFLQFSLGPWLKQIEQTIHVQLMRPLERKRYFVEHVRDAILQADTTTRYQSYALGRQWGWLSVNDIRALENMNPVDDGDQYLVPMNMVDASVAGELPEPEPTPEPTQDEPAQKEQPTRWLEPLIEDVAYRIARRHMADTKRAGSKATTDEWRNTHYSGLNEAISGMITPLLRAFGGDPIVITAGILEALHLEYPEEDRVAGSVMGVLERGLGNGTATG
jgi:HK97 family phage portal protein